MLSTCSGRDAPTITDVICGRDSVHAITSCGTLTSNSVAVDFSASTMSKVLSFQYVPFALCAWREAMWLSSGGGELRSYLPVSTPPMNIW